MDRSEHGAGGAADGEQGGLADTLQADTERELADGGRPADVTMTNAGAPGRNPANDPTVTRTGQAPTPESGGPPTAAPPITAASAPDNRTDTTAHIPHRDPTRYKIIREYARGGLGRVLQAEDREMGRPVAIKELLYRDPATEQRFLREALITGRLQHPGVVPVHEAGRYPSGKPYYSMKLVAGQPLRELIRDKQTLSERLALLPNVLAVAETIAYAHDHRIIHRDLKPSNVLVGDYGETIVIDWGLAKDLSDDSPEDLPSPSRVHDLIGSDLTVVGQVMGTPSYMPPEQARGQPVDARADVYSLGAMLYHVLSGQLPYGGTNSRELIEQVATAPPLPLEQVEPEVPPALAAVVDKAMARDATDRYPTAKEFADDVRRYTTGKLVAAHSYSRSELLVRWFQRHRAAVYALAAMLASAAIIGTIAIRRVVAEKRVATARGVLLEAERNNLILTQARMWLDDDPTRTIAWLKKLPSDAEQYKVAEQLAADAISRGVSKHVLVGHKASVTLILATDQEGEFLTTDRNGRMMSWNAATGRRRLIAEDVGKNYPVALSADRTTVYYGDRRGSVQRFELATGSRTTLAQAPPPITDVSISADSSTLAFSGDDHAVRLVSMKNGQVSVLPGHEQGSAWLEFSSDSTQLASVGASDNRIISWKLSDLSATDIPFPQDHPQYLQYSPDSRRIAVGTDSGRIILLDRATMATEATVAHGTHVRHLAFSPDGNSVAFTTGAKAVALYRIDSTEVTELHHHDQSVRGIAFSPSGELVASTGRDGTVRVSDINTSNSWSLIGHAAPIVGAPEFLDERTLATGDADGVVRVWVLPARSSHILRGHTRSTYNVAYSPQGNMLASTSNDSTVRLWSGDGAQLATLRGHDDATYALAWAPDQSKLASCGLDNNLRLWSPQGRPLGAQSAHTGIIKSCVFAPDSELLYSAAADGRLLGWNTRTNATVSVAELEVPLHIVAISPDGKWLAFAGDSDVAYLYEVDTAASYQLRAHTDRLYYVQFSPDGRLLATTGRDGRVYLWNVADRQQVAGYSQAQAVRDLVFSPDGHSVASSCDDGKVTLYKIGADSPTIIQAHHGRARRVAISKSGNLLASAGDDGAVWVSNLTTRHSAILRGHQGRVQALTFSPDGLRLATTGMDATVRMWDISPEIPSGIGTSVKPEAIDHSTSAILSTADQLFTHQPAARTIKP